MDKNIVVVRYSHSYSAFAGLGLHLRQLNRRLAEFGGIQIYQLFPVTAHRESGVSGDLLPCPKNLNERPLIITSTYTPGFKREMAIRRRLVDLLGRISPRLLHAVRSAARWAHEPGRIDVGLHLPLLTHQTRMTTESRDQLRSELDRIRAMHSDDHMLFMDHSAFQIKSIERQNDAVNMGFTVAIQHHGEFMKSFEDSLRMSSKHAHAAAVTLKGHNGELGENPVRLGNGIDTDYFNPETVESGAFRRRVSIPDAHFLILFPARIVKDKGQCDLITALRMLSARGNANNVSVVFAGPGSDPVYKEKIRRQIRDCPHGHSVSFFCCGALTQAELREAYRDADLVALTSYSEATGRVLVEAQAMGVPVVTYDVGGTSEALIDGVTGILVPCGDIEKLAMTVAEMIMTSRKRDSVSCMVARQFAVEHYSLTALAERHLNWYRRILGIDDKGQADRVS